MLQVPQAGVEATRREQRLVRALFDQHAAMKDQDPVRIRCAPQSMGDEDDGLACRELAEPA